MPFRPIELALDDGLLLASSQPAHAEALEELQRVVFPDLADHERFKAAHYRKHIELFPEGQFVVLDGARVVGMTTTIRMDFDFDHPHHRFEEIIAGGWLTSHQPGGAWLYGMDVGTHPDYRRRGIARALYHARHLRVRELGLDGQVTVGMLNGFALLGEGLTIEEYYARVERDELTDPTVSAQRRIGFELGGLVTDYLDDPTCGNAGALLILRSERDVPLRREPSRRAFPPLE